MVSDRAPVYLSARSADDILSEIRPTRLKGDALQSVNGFLDELLFLVLQTARSLSTTRLRDGLLKLLPTPLGKEAVLEAELELRSHRDRGSASPSSADDVVAKDFPVQAIFELLRLKCEACSTLNESDEDAEAETKLTAKLFASSSVKPAAVQPAVFYLTAILEHFCQHILSSVGRVVARDSSRTVASSHDLYTALCEDETIYSLFTRMKIHDTINAQSTLAKPRRSKSFSQSADFSSGSPRTSPVPTQSGRMSGGNDSAPRSSMEKARARIFKGSSQESANGHDHALPPAPHKRSQSSASNHRSNDRHDDVASYESDSSPSSQNFDEHLRSGETMKFSLTPDRLQSMETFKQQKSQKASNGQPTSPTRNGPNSPPGTTSPNRPSNNPRNKRVPVEAIDEGEEDIPPLPTAHRSPLSQIKNLSTSPQPGAMNGQWVAPPPRTHSKQESMGDAADVNGQYRPAPPAKTAPRNRESLDLDDIMRGPESDTGKSNLTPKNATAARSSSAKELMEFLADGPPEEFSPSQSTNSQASLAQDPRKGGGRFRSMVSRLRSRPSNEQLPGRGASEMGVNQTSLKKMNSQSGLANNPRPPKFNVTAPTSFQDPSPVASTQSLPPRARVTSATNRKAPPEWPNGSSDAQSIDSDGHETANANKNLANVNKFVPTPSPTTTATPVLTTPNKENKTKVDLTPTSTKNGTNGLLQLQINGHARPNTDKPGSGSSISKESVIELRQVLRQAETVAECRLLVDMFLAKSGLSSARPTPSQEGSPHRTREIGDGELMELILGAS